MDRARRAVDGRSSGVGGRRAGPRPLGDVRIDVRIDVGIDVGIDDGPGAAGLRREFGLQPGDRVAILVTDRPAYLEALFAAWHAGLVAVPVNARLRRTRWPTSSSTAGRRP